jgi:hypothetical protein
MNSGNKDRERLSNSQLMCGASVLREPDPRGLSIKSVTRTLSQCRSKRKARKSVDISARTGTVIWFFPFVNDFGDTECPKILEPKAKHFLLLYSTFFRCAHCLPQRMYVDSTHASSGKGVSFFIFLDIPEIVATGWWVGRFSQCFVREERYMISWIKSFLVSAHSNKFEPTDGFLWNLV